MTARLLSNRAQAAKSLDVAADASAEAVRAAFLRRLAAENFAPPESCVNAANLRANAALPLSPEAMAEAGAKQRATVEAFAAEYWSMDSALRRSHWQELVFESTDRFARARLEQLESGLALAVKPHDNPLVREIATAVRDQYVLTPRDRVIQRTIWLAERSEQIDDLRNAARRFRTDDPELATLGPELLSALARGMIPISVHSVDSAIVDAERSERAMKAAAVVQEQIIQSRGSAGSRSDTEQSGASDFKFGCGGLFVVIIVVRLIVAILNSSSKQDPLPPPMYNSPNDWRDFQPPRITPPEFTNVQIQSFIAYELNQFDKELVEAHPNVFAKKDRQKQPDLEKPPGFDDWISKGRPMSGRRPPLPKVKR